MLSDLPNRLFDELNRHLPEGALNVPKQELHSLLQAALGKLDLVTREEFDVQTAVLARTRQKLDEMEAKLDELLNPEEKP